MGEKGGNSKGREMEDRWGKRRREKEEGRGERERRERCR